MSEPSAGRTVAFGHVGLQVADLERSVAYYRDIIGLRLLERLQRDDAYLRVVTGYPDVTLDVAVLVEPASGALLELLQYLGVPGTPVDTATANPGTAHVCFQVDDVDAIWERARAAGFGAVNAPVTPTAGRWTGGRSVYLKDPDGIRVELVQRGPVAGPTGEPVPGEAVWLVEVRFAPDAAERRPPFRQQHLERIARLRTEGVIIEGGAFLDALSSSVMLIRAADADAARAVVEGDIYIPNGIWTDISVRPFGRVAN
ncbi:MAG: VOC family protein [Chloroflexota bacterium]